MPPLESQADAKAAPEHAIALRVFKHAPTACDPLRTHVPCIYKAETWCMFHDGEHDDEPIACEAQTAPALLHRARVCLDIEQIRPRTRIMIFQEEEAEPQVLDATKRRRVRLCGAADRMWSIEIGPHRATLDWTKTTCHTLDARTLTLRLGCDESFKGMAIEDGL